MITSIKVQKRSYREKQIAGARVYVSSSVGKTVDRFFNDHKIYALKFRCSTWNALKRKACESDIAELKTVFGKDAEISWSKTAGCSCGCSPGYVVKGKIEDKYRNADVWVSISTSTTDLVKLLPDFDRRLQAEITKKNS